MVDKIKGMLDSRIVEDAENLIAAIKKGYLPTDNFVMLQAVYDSIKSYYKGKFPKTRKYFGKTLYDAKWLTKNLTVSELIELYTEVLRLDGQPKETVERENKAANVSYNGMFWLIARHYHYTPDTIRQMKISDFNNAILDVPNHLVFERGGEFKDHKAELDQLEKEIAIIKRRKEANGNGS